MNKESDNKEKQNENKDNPDIIKEPYSYPAVAEEQLEEKAAYFRILGLPSLLYALAYTACMFQNSSGITILFWIGAVILYAVKVMYRLEHKKEKEGGKYQKIYWKQGSAVYAGIMLLLGAATVFTDNSYIILLNYAGFFVILIAFLLHNFCDDSGWDFAKGLSETMLAFFGAIGCMLTPFVDGYAYIQEKKEKKQKQLHTVFISFLFAVPGILILAVFLMNADAVFDAMVMKLLSGLRFPAKVIWTAVMLLFGFFSSYCGMRFLASREREDTTDTRHKFEPVIAMVFTGLTAVMYLVFCVIQVLYLFVGNMQLPKGMTYAGYARSGFFSLLFVCLINFCLVVLIKKYFNCHKLLDGMLLVICGCTFIMIASSAYRMLLYIGTYQLTFLRVSVLVILAALTLLMIGVTVSIVQPQFRLFRYCIIVTSTVYLVFAFSHVDYMIASYNLSHAQENESDTDWWYLSTMSMDAAPAVAKYYAAAPQKQKQQLDESAARAKVLSGTQDAYMLYDEPEKINWYGSYVNRVYELEEMDLRSFNFSRFWAQHCIKNRG